MNKIFACNTSAVNTVAPSYRFLFENRERIYIYAKKLFERVLTGRESLSLQGKKPVAHELMIKYK